MKQTARRLTAGPGYVDDHPVVEGAVGGEVIDLFGIADAPSCAARAPSCAVARAVADVPRHYSSRYVAHASRCDLLIPDHAPHIRNICIPILRCAPCCDLLFSDDDLLFSDDAAPCCDLLFSDDAPDSPSCAPRHYGARAPSCAVAHVLNLSELARNTHLSDRLRLDQGIFSSKDYEAIKVFHLSYVAFIVELMNYIKFCMICTVGWDKFWLL